MSKWFLPSSGEILLDHGATVLTVTSRSIAIDLAQVADEDQNATVGVAPSLERIDAVIGEMLQHSPDTCSDWYRGTLADYHTNRVPLSIAEVTALLRDNPAMIAFLRIGECTFRLLSQTGEVSPPQTLPHSPAATLPPDDSASPHRRAKDKYTQAVAFEFVSNVISNVIGGDLY